MWTLRSMGLASLGAGLLLQPLLASAETVFVEPDDFGRGAILNDAVPGVTLSASGRSTAGPEIQGVQTGLGRTSTGVLVFGYFRTDGSDGFTWRDDVVTQAFLRADFAEPTSFVAIDIVRTGGPGETTDPAVLWAFDADGNLLATARSLGGEVDFETLLLNRPSADIASVQVTGARDPVALDNLRFDVAGELPPPSCEARLQQCEADLTQALEACEPDTDPLEVCQADLAFERARATALENELLAARSEIAKLERQLERERRRNHGLRWWLHLFRLHRPVPRE